MRSAYHKPVRTLYTFRMSRDLPLCVDLDGTLLRTDTTWEAFVALVRSNPLMAVGSVFQLVKGKARFKLFLAAHASPDVSLFPLQKEFVSYLQSAHQQGRTLMLVTGAARSFGEKIAAHLKIFDEVIATDGDINITGSRKADVLVQRFGEKGFDYAGNSAVDLAVWPHARSAILVNAPQTVVARAKKLVDVELIFHDRPSIVSSLLKAVRPHQWVKNILIFVPIVTAHSLSNLAVIHAALLAFVAFSCCTSSVYLLNDLLDLPSDRVHPRKQHRPLASGDLPIIVALGVMPVLLLSSIALGLLLPTSFLLVLACYFTVTLLYSFGLKQLPVLDVLLLAGLYTVRIIAGHAATGLKFSLWLLLFSLFFFLSLALVKRFSELHEAQQSKRSIAGRGYSVADTARVGLAGAISGSIAVLILALYIRSEQVVTLYAQPLVLLCILPILGFWIIRIWRLAYRGQVHEDPVIFALHDVLSYVSGILISIVIFLAI